MSTTCDWCEGAGCESCQAPPAGNAATVCDWCEGAGCDSCKGSAGAATNTATAASSEPCGWCDGEGCDECRKPNANAGGGGSGSGGIEDDWGSGSGGGGGGGDDDWGASSSMTDAQKMTPAEEICNLFYGSEYEPEEKKYVELTKLCDAVDNDVSVLNDDEVRNVYNKAVQRVAVLTLKRDDIDNCVRQTALERFLVNIQHMGRDEARSGLFAYIDCLPAAATGSTASTSGKNNAMDERDGDSSAQQQHQHQQQQQQQWGKIATDIIIANLAVSPEMWSLMFALRLKQVKDAASNQDFITAREGVDLLYSLLNSGAEEDVRRRQDRLVDVYAQEIRVARMMKDTATLKSLYRKTRSVQFNAVDPRVQAVLKEFMMQYCADQGDWEEAYSLAFQAFNSCRELGDADGARRCLLYSMTANMICNADTNPMEAKEAKVYENSTPIITAVGKLRAAFENGDVDSFGDTLAELDRLCKGAGEDWVRKHFSEIGRQFKRRALRRIIRAYSIVTLRHLSRRLRCSDEDAQEVVVQMILDGELQATVDEVAKVVTIVSTNQRADGQSRQSQQQQQQQQQQHSKQPQQAGGDARAALLAKYTALTQLLHELQAVGKRLQI